MSEDRMVKVTHAGPLRHLLGGFPREFDPTPRADALGDPVESIRDFLTRQAHAVIEYDNGRGAPYLSADEYTRIKAVWLDETWAAPIVEFSKPTMREIAREELGPSFWQDGRLVAGEIVGLILLLFAGRS